MEINYKDIVDQILDIVHEKDLADRKILSDANISIDEGKKMLAKNNELFRLDVCKRLSDAFNAACE